MAWAFPKPACAGFFPQSRFWGTYPTTWSATFPPLKNNSVGITADSVARGCRAIFIHVHLGHLQLARVRSGDSVHNGCNGLAWAAPHSPEIHQDGCSLRQYFLVKTSHRLLPLLPIQP